MVFPEDIKSFLAKNCPLENFCAFPFFVLSSIPYRKLYILISILIDTMKKSLSNSKETNKIPVTFNDRQWEFIDKYRGILGETRAEVIRNIVLNWIISKEDRLSNENKK